MLGGPPIMSQPVYLSSPPTYPPASYPAVPAMASPGTWTGRPAQTAPAPPSSNLVRAQQSATPRPIFRAKGRDEPTPTPSFAPVADAPGSPTMPRPVSIPTPEQLGIAPAIVASAADLDWTATHRQLERLGAICYHFDKLETGGCRFACLLPTRQAGLTHRVEADAGGPPGLGPSGAMGPGPKRRLRIDRDSHGQRGECYVSRAPLIRIATPCGRNVNLRRALFAIQTPKSSVKPVTPLENIVRISY